MTFDQAIALPGVLLGKVNGGSMYPILHTGDLIVVQPGPIRVGDIVMFDIFGVSVTHRILALAPQIVTKGDNVPRLDNFNVQPEAIKGVVFGVYRPATGRFLAIDRSYTHPKFVFYAKLELRLCKMLFWMQRLKAEQRVKQLLQPLYYGLIYRRINAYQQPIPHGPRT
jgi:signal peptidase I